MFGIKQYFSKIIAFLNVIVGIGIVLSVIAHNISPGKIAFLQITGLVFPSLAMLSLAFLLYFILTKRKFVVISLLIVLISLSSYPRNFQITIFNKSVPEKNDIKLLTYNVQRFGISNNNEGSQATRDTILNFLIKENAGIYCLQEYHSTSGSLYGPLKKIRDTLGAATYYYESYYNPRYNQLSGLAIFSDYKAIDKGKLKFQGSRTFGIYLDLLINSDTVRLFNIHLASIKLQPADLDYVTNTHPDKDNKSSSIEIYHKLADAYKLREKQINLIRKEINKSPYPVILCGDFNDSPNSWAYNNISSELNDAFREKGNGLSKTYNGPIPMLRIDYIFTDDFYKAKGYHRYRHHWSDHFPISSIITKD